MHARVEYRRQGSDVEAAQTRRSVAAEPNPTVDALVDEKGGLRKIESLPVRCLQFY